MINKNSLILVKEAAKYLRVSTFTIRRLLKSGKLKGSRMGSIGSGGNKWLIKRSDFNNYMKGLHDEERSLTSN